MIRANFSAYGTYTVDSLYQWDVNRVLHVPGLNLTTAPEVHFSNAHLDRAVVRQSRLEQHVVSVDIPNSLLQDPLPIKAHIGVYEGTAFRVIELVEIPVIPRKRPADYRLEDTDGEIYSFKRLENALANQSMGLGKATCRVLRRVCCCGDGYTSGHMVDGEQVAHEQNEDFAWPHYMAAMTGNEWINCGVAGANVLSWLTDPRGLARAQTAGRVQAYLIGLLVNDAAAGTDRHVELGRPAHMGTDARSYYGGMSRILQELHTISPQALLFVQTFPHEDDTTAPYNQAVREMVAAYRGTYPVHCLDLAAYADLYRTDGPAEEPGSDHTTALRQEQLAELLGYVMSDYLNTYAEAVQHIPWIPCDG